MTARILSIAGSDSGGGAGIQADIKTACAFGVYASTAVTAITAQNTLAVTGIEAVSPEMVAAQIEAVLSDIGADAIKVGMLANAGICKAVAASLEGLSIPIVLDPVMVSTSGSALLEADAIEIIRNLLVPRATLVTPNLPEMDVLAGLSNPSRDERMIAAKTYSRAHGIALLMKDGHGERALIEDVLVMPNGAQSFTTERLDTIHTHGTGCTLSTAIACALATGKPLREAVIVARKFVHEGIKSAPGLGGGHGPLNFIQ